MKRILAITVPAVVTISLALSLTIGESALAQSNRRDEEAIRKVILDGIEAFNRHDAKAGTIFFTEDADFVTVYGRWSRGAAEIERSRTERFQTALREAKIKLLDLRIRFIKPDVAIAHETHELSGMVGSDGERVPPQRELSIRVLVKERGKWLITAFHNTVVRAAVASPSVEGAWRVAEIASRTPGETWAARPGPPAGLYVFSARHYAYFYVPGVQPRARFADANRPTEAEKTAAYDSFIAGAGPYTFDGRTLELRADLRKNPNEMTGEVWRWQAEARGDTLRLVFVDPPFLPGRDWRVTLVRVE